MAAREFVGVRIGSGAREWIDALAEETRTTRTAVIRAALRYATQHRADIVRIIKEGK